MNYIKPALKVVTLDREAVALVVDDIEIALKGAEADFKSVEVVLQGVALFGEGDGGLLELCRKHDALFFECGIELVAAIVAMSPSV